MPRQHHQAERGESSGGGKVVWDTGSSLYDSYELAAVRRLLDRSLAGVRPLPDERPPVPAESKRDDSKQQLVAVSAGARRAGRKKVTLRKLFRAVVSWVIRPRKAKAHACTCVVMAHGGGAVEPLFSPRGKA